MQVRWRRRRLPGTRIFLRDLVKVSFILLFGIVLVEGLIKVLQREDVGMRLIRLLLVVFGPSLEWRKSGIWRLRREGEGERGFKIESNFDSRHDDTHWRESSIQYSCGDPTDWYYRSTSIIRTTTGTSNTSTSTSTSVSTTSTSTKRHYHFSIT